MLRIQYCRGFNYFMYFGDPGMLSNQPLNPIPREQNLYEQKLKIVSNKLLHNEQS